MSLNRGLLSSSRLRRLVAGTEDTRPWELAVLLGFGVAAAVASTCLDLRLRIPGHAILRAVFPLAVGLALVPRRGAGATMSVTALLASLPLGYAIPSTDGMSLGALTSLALIGPSLDWCLRRVRTGWQAYLGFAAAGLLANLGAFAARTAAKLAGLDRLGAQPLSTWLPQAALSYALCGGLAGVVSALIWFQRRRPDVDAPGEPAP
jgi:hypothetical protein